MFAADPRTLNRIAPSIRRIVIADPNPASARLLMDIMKGIGSREVFIESDEERALELLRVHPGMAAAREETLEVGRRATASLDALPDSDAKTALIALMDGVIHRVG